MNADSTKKRVQATPAPHLLNAPNGFPKRPFAGLTHLFRKSWRQYSSWVSGLLNSPARLSQDIFVAGFKNRALRSLPVFGVLIFKLIAPQVTQADAFFSGDVEFSMEPRGGAIENAFGWGGPLYSSSSDNVNINDSTTYDGKTSQTASGAVLFRLSNLTGSGSPTPPGRDIPVTMIYTFTYSLMARILGPGFDQANVRLHIYTSSGLEFEIADIRRNETDPVLSDITEIGSFDLIIPQNSTTDLIVQFGLSGNATSELPAPDPLPERDPLPDIPPSPVPEGDPNLAFVLGLLGLFAWRHKMGV